MEKSASLQLYALDLIDALFCDVSPIPVKRALNAMGYAAGPCRLPLCGMEPAAEERLLACLRTYGLLPVSYTHLDVYKRQSKHTVRNTALKHRGEYVVRIETPV